MTKGGRRAVEPLHAVIFGVLTLVLGWWFLNGLESGRIAVKAGSRAARAPFIVDRMTDPGQFNAALIVIAVLALASLAAFASTTWDLFASARLGDEGA